jgi:periplasmic copper chaperone A
MKRLIAAALLLTAGIAFPSYAHEYKLGDLRIGHPWARATPGHSPNGAAYLTLSTEGAQSDRLTSVATPVAAKAELHTHLMEGNVMKMRPVEAIEIAPGAPIVLQPGGLHVMLMGLKAPLKEGDRFPLTLTFEHAGNIEVEVVVEKPGAMEPAHMDHKAGS